MLSRAKLGIAALTSVLGAVGVYGVEKSLDGYDVTIVVPSAAQIVTGSPVLIDGFEAGQVEGLRVSNGKAVIEASLSEEFAPLTEGSRSQIEWKDAVGERVVTIVPGPKSNAQIPDGGMLSGVSRQIEVDQLLSALDAKTRARLKRLLGRANLTVQSNDTRLRETLQSLGPAVEALGEIMRAVGRDGPAIRDLVKQVHEMASMAAERRDDVSGVVKDLTALTTSVAREQAKLSRGLGELPSTLKVAEDTLRHVPDAADAAVPLLKDLRPAAQRLPRVARNLSPLLQDLRPASADLRSTLVRVQQVLRVAPGLLDVGHAVVPPTSQAVKDYQPAVSFLRPYTPEAVGWIHNWGQNFAPYDSQGHVWAAVLAPGSNAVNESVVQPPGSTTSLRPDPGEVVGQPWTDAHGSSMQ
jgi:phospholipid/cholesterol/gamma-HCH transport system substrate-binding protein